MFHLFGASQEDGTTQTKSLLRWLE
jgi:hypothetical protein